MDTKEIRAHLEERFTHLYGKDGFDYKLISHLLGEITRVQRLRLPPALPWSERDIVLITYGDTITRPGRKPLAVLADFLCTRVQDAVSHVHILPFFPFSSDDGFSVIDYRRVNPALGDWGGMRELGKHYRLMADLVINHVSQESLWFRNYLAGKAPGNGFFIEADPHADLSRVVRPRSLPLLTPVTTVKGRRHVWTTFSADQIDLNFANPVVLTEMLKIFLFYLEQGISVIRLDAIAFLWKEPGTSCLHLSQTHEVVKLMRDIAACIDPGILLITETNVPHAENVSYFGNGDEAHMVYQFSLPPLLLHALRTGDATVLYDWLNSLPALPAGCTFLNFTASHDGVGVRPLEGLLPAAEIAALAEGVKSHGGLVSTKHNADGTDSPYELNISYLDALRGPDGLQAKRFLCAETLMLSLQGIPALYIHSLLGTPNDLAGVARTGRARSINRRQYTMEELSPLLDGPTEQGVLFGELVRRLRIRKTVAAFHPEAAQRTLPAPGGMLTFIRGNNKALLVAANLTAARRTFMAEGLPGPACTDLLTGRAVTAGEITLEPYQVCWISGDRP